MGNVFAQEHRGLYQSQVQIDTCSSDDHLKSVVFCCFDKAIEAQLHCRFVKYLVSLRESDNVLLRLGFKLCLSGSCFNTCNSYVYIKERYNMKSDFSDHEKVYT